MRTTIDSAPARHGLGCTRILKGIDKDPARALVPTQMAPVRRDVLMDSPFLLRLLSHTLTHEYATTCGQTRIPEALLRIGGVSPMH